MRSLLAVLTLLPTLALAAAPELAATLPADFNKELIDNVVSDFTAAYKDQAEVLEPQLAYDNNKMPHILMPIRPKKDGMLTIVYRYQIDLPINKNLPLPGYNSVEQTFEFWVGKKNQPRMITHRYENSATPLANVGDTVLIPLPIPAGFKSAKFLHESRLTQYRLKDADKIAAWCAKPEEQFTSKVDTDNQAKGDLKIIGAGSITSPHRMMGRASGIVTLLMQTAAAGKFSFVAEADRKPNGRAPAERISLNVIAADQPVTVMVNFVDTREYKDNVAGNISSFRISTPIEARVGDYLTYTAFEDVVTFNESAGEKLNFVPPALTLKKLDYEKPQLKFTPVP